MITFENFSFRYEERDGFTLKGFEPDNSDRGIYSIDWTERVRENDPYSLSEWFDPHFYPGEMKGDIFLDGQSLLELKPADLAGKVGTVFQDPRSQFL